jgi:hypothetical protein
MKHWDLVPGESVALTKQGGRAIYVTFRFRDTVRARFDVDDDSVSLLLGADGDLYDDGRQRWSIGTNRAVDQSTRQVSWDSFWPTAPLTYFPLGRG